MKHGQLHGITLAWTEHGRAGVEGSGDDGKYAGFVFRHEKAPVVCKVYFRQLSRYNYCQNHALARISLL